MDDRTAQAIGLMKAWQPLTHDGYEKVIYAVYEGQQENPIHGAVKVNGEWVSVSWVDNGRRFAFGHPHPFDLLPALPEKRVLKGWVNVYEGALAIDTIHPTKNDADHRAFTAERKACVYVEIPYTPGEGL